MRTDLGLICEDDGTEIAMGSLSKPAAACTQVGREEEGLALREVGAPTEFLKPTTKGGLGDALDLGSEQVGERLERGLLVATCNCVQDGDILGLEGSAWTQRLPRSHGRPVREPALEAVHLGLGDVVLAHDRGWRHDMSVTTNLLALWGRESSGTHRLG